MSILDEKRAQASGGGGADQPQRHGQHDNLPELVVPDGLHSPTALPDNPELGADEDVPPAYSEDHDRLSLHQAGFDAGAAVTGES
jgi:hypothetical protein